MRSPPPPSGLCSRCRHARAVETRRGSIFVLCELSKADPRFVRYPRLPIIRCTGYESIEEAETRDRPGV